MDYDFSVSAFGLLCLLCLLLLAEVGFRAGNRARYKTDPGSHSQSGFFESAILGILGLLLGFTISMTVAHYDERRHLVIQEANAIGTVWLRGHIMPAPENAQFLNRVSDYVDLRIRFAAAKNAEELVDLRRQQERLQDDLWSRAASFASQDARSVQAGLLIQSLNQMIDVEAANWAFMLNRVPDAVLYVNILIALLASLLLGYNLGLTGQRDWFATLILTVSITAVLVVIVDLDHPWAGFVKISQQPMMDLVQRIHSEP